MSALYRNHWHLACAALAATLVAVPAIAQTVTLERDSPLYSEPRLEAPQTAQLKQGASGEVVGKQGGWLNIRTPAGAGWLLSFNVRYPAQRTDGAAPGPAVGPRRSVAVASTIGIRGLEEEDLRQATFNAGQMKLLDDYVVSRPAAEEGARAAGLAPARVDYLDAKK